MSAQHLVTTMAIYGELWTVTFTPEALECILAITTSPEAVAAMLDDAS